MTVYVDDARNRFQRMVMCHMIGDTVEELHAMSADIGLLPEWFQPKSWPHYDVSLTRRRLAVQAGAREVTQRELVAVIRQLRAKANL